MGVLTSSLYEALKSQQFIEFFSVYLNQYWPYGSFWWITGATIMAIMHMRTKNFAYTMAFATIYFVGVGLIPGLVTDQWARVSLTIFGIISGMVLGWYMYQVVVKDCVH